MRWQISVVLSLKSSAPLFFVIRPDLIPYENLTKSTAPENLQCAFDVAEREFNIAPLLDVSGKLVGNLVVPPLFLLS